MILFFFKFFRFANLTSPTIEDVQGVVPCIRSFEEIAKHEGVISEFFYVLLFFRTFIICFYFYNKIYCNNQFLKYEVKFLIVAILWTSLSICSVIFLFTHLFIMIYRIFDWCWFLATKFLAKKTFTYLLFSLNFLCQVK